MVVGANGVNGTHVQCLVEVLAKRKPVYVIVQRRNTVVINVRWMDQRTQNLKDVTKIHAQVSQLTM